MANLKILIAFATPDVQKEMSLEIGQDSTVAMALTLVAEELAQYGFDIDSAPLGIWGKACTRETQVKEGDRIEVYRPLETDPKEARRARARRREA